jgi:hypothetical protein
MTMRMTLNIIGGIALLLGAIWTLQGANIIGGSVMSGQSFWLYVGIAVLLVGAALLGWTNLRKR